jgi:hypothetical protein
MFEVFGVSPFIMNSLSIAINPKELAGAIFASAFRPADNLPQN